MAAGATYAPIASTTLSASASSVSFSSIPQTYTDLILIIISAGTAVNDPLLRFNSDSGSNYSYTGLTGNTSTASSVRASSQTAVSLNYFGSDSTSLGDNARRIDIMSYSNTSIYKTVFTRGGRATTDGIAILANAWRSTSAITTLTLTPGSGSYISGSTFNLYGVTAA